MFTASHRAPSAFFIARSEVTGAGSQRQSLNYMGRELPQEVRDAARLPSHESLREQAVDRLRL